MAGVLRRIKTATLLVWKSSKGRTWSVATEAQSRGLRWLHICRPFCREADSEKDELAAGQVGHSAELPKSLRKLRTFKSLSCYFLLERSRGSPIVLDV